jgi:hypothetical protein
MDKDTAAGLSIGKVNCHRFEVRLVTRAAERGAPPQSGIVGARLDSLFHFGPLNTPAWQVRQSRCRKHHRRPTRLGSRRGSARNVVHVSPTWLIMRVLTTSAGTETTLAKKPEHTDEAVWAARLSPPVRPEARIACLACGYDPASTTPGPTVLSRTLAGKEYGSGWHMR